MSNFHWFVYPFFKTIEKLCDKVFGCRRKADEINEKFRVQREQEQLEKQIAWEEEKRKMKMN